MTLFRTTEPAAEPLTLAEAKANLRLDHDGEDELVEGLIRAAREEVEASFGLALIDQTWRLALDRVRASGEVVLLRHPVREILSVTVYDGDGGASLVDPGDYELDAHCRPVRLYFARIPWSAKARNGIEIDFAAGFGEAATDVPDLVKRAMQVLVAHWFEFRAAFGAADQPVAFPEGYRRLMAPYRQARL